MKLRFFSIAEVYDYDRVQYNSLVEEGVTVLKDWPAQSPDLIIEQM